MDAARPTGLSGEQAERREQALAATIGKRVREYRLDRAMTIAQLAATTGISKGMLSKVENSQTSASLSTLARLADALTVPVTAFFRGLEEEHDAFYVPYGQGIKINPTDAAAGRTYELLSDTRGPHKRLEPVRVRLDEPTDVFPLYQHRGTEYIYMLEGSLEYGYGTARYTLEPGDSLAFEGEVPHGPTELRELPVEFLSIKAWGRIE